MDSRQIKELHGALICELDNVGYGEFHQSGITPIVPPEFEMKVADDPSKSYVVDSGGRQMGVLILSSVVNPQLVQRSVEKAREAKRTLTKELGSVVLEPIVADTFRDLSYAIWPIHRDLSSLRILRYLQKVYIRPRVLCWLRVVAEDSICTEIVPDQIESDYVIPLTRLADDSRLSRGLRDAAMDALDRLGGDLWHPATVLQHSDLWLGNILLPLGVRSKNRNRYGFFIIDWAGASLSGHPFFDLLVFGLSAGVSVTRLRSEIGLHSRIVHCDLQDAVSYLLAGLGAVGVALEHFPESRYVTMCERVYGHLSATLGRA